MASKLKRIRKYNRKKRIRTHGFRQRMETWHGRRVLARRRKKGRNKLVVQKKK